MLKSNLQHFTMDREKRPGISFSSVFSLSTLIGGRGESRRQTIVIDYQEMPKNKA